MKPCPLPQQPDARERARKALLENGMSKRAAKKALDGDAKAIRWVDMFSYTNG